MKTPYDKRPERKNVAEDIAASREARFMSDDDADDQGLNDGRVGSGHSGGFHERYCGSRVKLEQCEEQRRWMCQQLCAKNLQ